MRKNLEIIFALLVGIACGVASYGSYVAHTASRTLPEKVVEYVYIESEPQVITEVEYVYVPVAPEVYRPNLTSRECDLLEQIAYAEAKGEGVKGMILVMNVVLNRVNAEGFGDSVEEVIFADGQFYTAGMTPDVSDECHEALAMVLDGTDFSQGALFFNKYGYRNGKEALFQYGNHYFSR